MERDRVTGGMGEGDARIEVLGLSARTSYNLKRRNITTVRMVLSLPKQDLIDIVQLTPENFAEPRGRLIACGFLSPTHLIGAFAEEAGDQEADT